MSGRYRTAVDEVTDHAWSYGALAFGTAVEATSKATSFSISAYFNPWLGDKIALHAPFSGGLTHIASQGTERGSYTAAGVLQGAAERTEHDAVGRYLEQGAEALDDPSTKRAIAASGLAITGFSYVTEYDPATGLAYIDAAIDLVTDPHPDVGDIAANYSGWAWYHLYHNGPDAVQERVNGVYDRIRERFSAGED